MTCPFDRLRDDVVQTALNPPDAYKTSVLSGLAPTIILDIASRAMVSQSNEEVHLSGLTNQHDGRRTFTLIRLVFRARVEACHQGLIVLD